MSAGQGRNLTTDSRYEEGDDSDTVIDARLAEFYEEGNDAYNLDESEGEEKELKDKQARYKLVFAKFPETQIRANSSAKLYWDLCIVFGSIYQAIEIPIALSFDLDVLH